MKADLANLSVTTWLVLLGCVGLWLLYGYVCWKAERDER